MFLVYKNKKLNQIFLTLFTQTANFKYFLKKKNRNNKWLQMKADAKMLKAFFIVYSEGGRRNRKRNASKHHLEPLAMSEQLTSPTRQDSSGCLP